MAPGLWSGVVMRLVARHETRRIDVSVPAQASHAATHQSARSGRFRVSTELTSQVRSLPTGPSR